MKSIFSDIFVLAAVHQVYGLETRGAAGSGRLSRVGGTSTDTNGDVTLNWSGAVLNVPPSGTTFTSVSAEFNVPTPRPADHRADSSSVWADIDGNTYRNAILQTGIDLSVASDGSASFDVWYEWYPDYAQGLSNITVEAGDRISLCVVSTSSSTGTVTIQNITNGQKASQSLSAPDSSSTLGGQNAEWIVEDYEVGGRLVVLDNFGTVTFSNASAGLSDSSSVGIDGADVMNILQNGEMLTSVLLNASKITITSQSEEEAPRVVPEDDREKEED